jgi:putative molybdopterin biosynthesis protein
VSNYLTTREVADLLRIKERKVYELVATGELPHSKVIGKLLFPRAAVEAWVDGEAGSGVETRKLPAILLGSHDPLLDWAIRESRCGIATLFDSSIDGLDRFAANEGLAVGIHVPDSDGDDWNISEAKQKLGTLPVVLVEWAWRQRGLVLASGLASQVKGLKDLKGMRILPRQPEAGTQILLERLLAAEDLSLSDFEILEPARSEAEIVDLVAGNKADAGFALQCIAAQHQVDFLPVLSERYDIIVDRYHWFEPPFQRFLEFVRSEKFGKQAATYTGYDLSGLLTVKHNV